MSWLLTEKGKLYYRTNADYLENKPFLFLIHGAGSDGRVWIRLFPNLKDEVAVVIPDLPGHGKSEGKPSSNLIDYIEVIDKLAEEFNQSRFFIGGHSMGGAISLLYALEHPERISGVIIYASSSSLPVNPDLLKMIKVNFEMLATLSTQFSFAKNDEEITFFKNMVTEMTKENGSDVLYKDMIACNEYSVERRIKSLRVPVQIFAGQKDKMVSIKNIKAFYEDILAPKNITILENAGHMLILEEPDIVATETISFINNNLSAN